MFKKDDLLDRNFSPHAFKLEELLRSFDVNASSGLSEDQVNKRHSEFGKNALREEKKRSLLQVFLSQFKNPLVYLLFIAAFVTLFLGQKSDPFVVLAVVLINAIMGTIQEGRAERSLQSLRKFSAQQNRVLRGDKESMILASELVPGDILIFSAGDAIGADCRILEEHQLEVNESSLTGESLPVYKEVATLAEDAFVADRKNMLFMGTFVVAGRAKALVVGTGEMTEIGKIVDLAEAGPPSKTPIEQKIDQFGKWIALVALVVFFSFVVLGLIQGLPKADIILAATSQLVSVIPEGLPIAITIALAIGVQRMAAHRAIVRKLVAVETLGSTNVICTDKTGTLTKNEMTVTEVFLPQGINVAVTGEGYSPKGDLLLNGKKTLREEVKGLNEILDAMILCNDAQIDQGKVLGDPTEAALLVVAKKAEIEVEHVKKVYPRVGEIPFDSGTKLMVTFHQAKERSFAIVKGALEQVLPHCSSAASEQHKLYATHQKEILEQAAKESKKGLRILGFLLIEGQKPVESYEKLSKGVFLGFVAQQDPPRAEVFKAVEACHHAQIKPVMITGDHAATALAIAKQTGIYDGNVVIEGKELEHMTTEQLVHRASEVSVYARVHPAQKLKIVDAYQRLGYVVAMTGDGVNDAPALAKADVGIAMGISGTEVAKEAAKMVILDDNFSTIVHAIREGRVVYNNLKKVVFYLVSTSFSAVFLVLIAIAMGYPLPLAAVQILWINVITEGTVTINLIMEGAEGHEMFDPPTGRKDALIGRFSTYRMLFITPIISLILLGYFLFRSKMGIDITRLQTEVFSLFAFCAWFNVINCRSNWQSIFSLRASSNRYLAIGIALGIVLHMAVLYIPMLNVLFRCVPLEITTLLKLLALASTVLWVEELRKWGFRVFKPRKKASYEK